MIVYYILKNLILTEIIEIFFSFILGIRNINNYKIIILMNIITNVTLSFITYTLFSFVNINFYIYLIIIETIVILTEKIILEKYFDFDIEKIFLINKIKTNNYKSFCLSLILNFSSIIFGNIISKFI